MQVSIKQFTRNEIAVLNTEIQTSLDLIKTKFGLAELNIQNISFTSTSFTAKLTSKTIDSDQDIYNKYESEFFIQTNGLPIDLLGKGFSSMGRLFTVVRIDMRKPKYPIIAQCHEDNKMYKFSIERIKELLK